MRTASTFSIFAAALLLSINFSCRCRKDASVVESTPSGPDSAIVSAYEAYSFTLSFISRGEGVSQTAMQKADELLTPYVETGAVAIEKYNWGREGEVDYCVRIVSMAPDQESELFDSLRELAASDALVFIDETGKCERRR